MYVKDVKGIVTIYFIGVLLVIFDKAVTIVKDVKGIVTSLLTVRYKSVQVTVPVRNSLLTICNNIVKDMLKIKYRLFFICQELFLISCVYLNQFEKEVLRTVYCLV